MQALGSRLAVVALATLLAGLLLPARGIVGGFDRDEPGRPAAAVETTAVTVASAAVTGRTAPPAWRLALLRTAAALLGLLAAVLLAGGRRPPVPAWQLVRADRTRVTARHCSPLAAGRAPPAPARP